jgi:hypothetical protein
VSPSADDVDGKAELFGHRGGRHHTAARDSENERVRISAITSERHREPPASLVTVGEAGECRLHLHGTPPARNVESAGCAGGVAAHSGM